jgi:hypothetical protein
VIGDDLGEVAKQVWVASGAVVDDSSVNLVWPTSTWYASPVLSAILMEQAVGSWADTEGLPFPDSPGFRGKLLTQLMVRSNLSRF